MKIDFTIESEKLDELKVRLKHNLITYNEYLNFFKVTFLNTNK